LDATNQNLPAAFSHAIRREAPVYALAFLVLALTSLGLLVLSSAGRSTEGQMAVYATKQFVWLVIALIAFAVCMKVNWVALREFAVPIGVLSLGFLIVVLVPFIGLEINGARRWISLGVMNMQTSDFAKIGYLFFLSHFLATRQNRIQQFREGYLYPGLIIGAAFGLVMLQPDYGTAALFASVGGTLLFLAGSPLLYLLPTAFLGVSLFGVAIWLDPVRLQRILSFLDLEANKEAGAYQLWQGILAFGVGGTHGAGLGNGRQQLAFLPEAHTDFIFPIIGEELGLIATSATALAFLGIFLIVGLRLQKAPDMFQFLLVTGALLLITGQALVNFGVSTGLLPTKGMSLPFISYGGSNLVSMFILLGIIVNRLRAWEIIRLRAREVRG
jgi:cell division protein FtsW